jgi:hypothetical protein
MFPSKMQYSESFFSNNWNTSHKLISLPFLNTVNQTVDQKGNFKILTRIVNHMQIVVHGFALSKRP